MIRVAEPAGPAECRCVAVHRPGVLRLETHHIWPVDLGGPDEPRNVVWLCPSAHRATHLVLWHLIAGETLPWGEARRKWPTLNRHAFHLAHAGHNAWREHRFPPDPPALHLVVDDETGTEPLPLNEETS